MDASLGVFITPSPLCVSLRLLLCCCVMYYNYYIVDLSDASKLKLPLPLPRGSYMLIVYTLPGIPIAASGRVHTGEYTNSLELSSMCVPASQAALSINRMQLTLHATRRTLHSRLVQAINICLVGQNPTCSVPAL